MSAASQLHAPWWEAVIAIGGAMGIGGIITALIQKHRPREDSAAVVVGAAKDLVSSAAGLSESLTEEIVRLKGDVAAFREQNTQLEAHLIRLEADLDAALQRAQDLEAENERLRADNDRLRSERDQLRGERDQLKQVLASSQRTGGQA